MKKFGLVVAVCLSAQAASAEVVDGNAARKMMFSVKGHSIQVSSALSDTDAQTVRAVIPLMAEQLRQPVRYYASIAWSPDDGLVHEALQAAMNYHSSEASDAAAIAACNAVRSSGAQGCQVAARIVPKRYKPQPLTLSLDATAAFDKSYRKAKSPKSLAISRETGGWGIGGSDQAAVSACENAAGQVGDCEIVIRD
jgi:hypothetical protein